jgi:hypothetical protein
MELKESRRRTSSIAKTTIPYLLLAALALAAACHAAGGEDWFAPCATVADYKPKGPSHCFRQFNIDWSWICRRPEQIPEFLSQADPAAFAEFCRTIHLDGTIVMAVPHHGYCSYETKIGTKFPGMRGDWFGRTIDELHKRRIAAFGYVTLNWNWKYMREHYGEPLVHAKLGPDGAFDSGYICLNAPGYLDLVEGYTREVLERYPVDGMRWDILATAKGCTCAGCRAFYREQYGEELRGWDGVDWRRREDFYLATTGRAARRLHDLCKRIKPSVEIWQNSIQTYAPNHLDLGRIYDVAYNEYGDPFRLLLLRGVMNKEAAINGLMNQTPVGSDLKRSEFRLSLALGGRCYSYYGHKLTNARTALPGPEMMPWHLTRLAPFYAMVSEIQPWLEGARPVSPVGVVFSENTRFRYRNYDRGPYIAELQKITGSCLGKSLPLEFINRLDLGDAKKAIGRLKLLVVPLTSGLRPEELDALVRYVRQGGSLLVAGDALRHGEKGEENSDFALAGEMGIHYAGAAGGAGVSPVPVEITGKMPVPPAVESHRQAAGYPLGGPASPRIRQFVRVRPAGGETLMSVRFEGESWPLLHVSRLGAGRIVYLASLDSVELTQAMIEWLAGPLPVTVTPAEKGPAIITHQPESSPKRWIVHLIGDGGYTLRIDRSCVPATRVVDRYPKAGWQHRETATAAGLQLEIRGDAQDRLLVLE